MGKRALLFLLFFAVLECKAQNPQFAQGFSSPIYLNPAFAGFDGAPRITTAYRNQWPAISSTF